MLKNIESKLSKLGIDYDIIDGQIVIYSNFGSELKIMENDVNTVFIYNDSIHNAANSMIVEPNNVEFSINYCIDEAILTIASSFHAFTFGSVIMKED